MTYLPRAFFLGLSLVTLLSASIPLVPIQAESTDENVYLVVELKDTTNDPTTDKVLRRQLRDVRSLSDRLPRNYIADGKKLRTQDLRRWRVVAVPSSRADVLLAELKANPAVISVRRENIYQTTQLTNDPLLPQQYALSGSPGISVQATSAWDKTTGSGNTVIAIIDGGVDLTHEDLMGKIWKNPKESQNGRDDDGNGFIDDIYGWDFVTNQPVSYAHKHGTHVAGIAAASGNNGKGISGVNHGARIMSVRVLNQSGLGREEWIVRGIEYAVANGAKIINLSIAGSVSAPMLDAIEQAYANNVLVVAAAGNSGLDTTLRKVYPVCADRNGINMVLGVGATNSKGEPARFSNYGSCVDVSAPGDDILSTTPGNRYQEMSGTSMSSPLAAGIAGLYLAQNPGASPSQVIGRLRDSLDSFSGSKAALWNARYKGKLNAAKVVGAPAVSVPLPTISPQPSTSPASPPATPQANNPAELSIELAGPGENKRGTSFVYTITVRNSGGSSATNVQAIADIDRDTNFISGADCSLDGRDVVCSRNSLSAGSTTSFAITVDVADGARCNSSLRSRATVYMDERGRSRRQDNSERLKTTVTCE